eukprot:CAMPEP_0171067680 /NCGR_PEP_ID=MMETSP0766_2-20121228/8135_1 /TAXON_ID=439317 /ORGANISM="Gambierdiscus australes, Strain CAWD 149" /LENGTH=448 /DNA_ID=CAMNT_0011523937 /DNA_START=58 /DNA_END=1404 /DNA_ORIENTATION=-
MTMQRSASCSSKRKLSSKHLRQQEETWLQKVFNGNAFALVSACVIACNTVAMGYSTNESIAWQIKHVGGEEMITPDWLRYAGYGFIFFYTLELLLKLYVFRCKFFRNENWQWNIFDFVLVVCGLYEVSMDFRSSSQNEVNVAWMRLLRLLRMSKMLRVVRIMRFFRVLRMMMSAIAGSMMTLLWSIALLCTLNFIFGLTFLQILSSYLSETPVHEVEPDTLLLISNYWGSVWQAIITLYAALTGGTDWSSLAKPIRIAGEAYHVVFLFYIAFTFFSVVNVMTGLYVESAEKVAKEDYQSVGSELAKRGETRKFVDFFRQVQSHKRESTDDPRDYISIAVLEEHFNSEVVQTFARIAELTLDDFRTVFAMLDVGGTGKVLLSDFLDGCLHTNSASVSLDMLVLTSETLKCSRQQTRLMEMLQKRFDEVSCTMSRSPADRELWQREVSLH